MTSPESDAGLDSVVVYPVEGDEAEKDYSLRILIADGKGGWRWRNIKIRAPHIYKVQFSDIREVAGFGHSHYLNAAQASSTQY